MNSRPSELHLWTRQWRAERIRKARADHREREVAFASLHDKTTDYAMSLKMARDVCAQVLALWEASPVDLPAAGSAALPPPPPGDFTWPPKACPCNSSQKPECQEHGCKWERDPSLVPEALRSYRVPAAELDAGREALAAPAYAPFLKNLAPPDSFHPQFVSGFWHGHALGRKRGIAAAVPHRESDSKVADLPGMARQGALQAALDALEDSDIPAAAAIVKTLMAAAGVPESDSIGRDGQP